MPSDYSFEGKCPSCKTEYCFPAKPYSGCREKHRSTFTPERITIPSADGIAPVPAPLGLGDAVKDTLGDHASASTDAASDPAPSIPEGYAVRNPVGKRKVPSVRYQLNFGCLLEFEISKKDGFKKSRWAIWHFITDGPHTGKMLPLYANKPSDQVIDGNDNLAHYLEAIGWGTRPFPTRTQDAQAEFKKFWQDHNLYGRISARARLTGKSKTPGRPRYSILAARTFIIEDPK